MSRGLGKAAVAGVLAVVIWILAVPGARAAGPPAAVAPSPAAVALPPPRFATLHADKVYLRSGPGDRYPIQWVYVRKGWPVEIIGQLDHWRHVRDWEGTEGWVHERMITNKREVIVKGAVRALRRGPDLGAALVARAEPGVMARLVECRGEWCRIDVGDLSGWVERANVWGVSPTEVYPN